MRSKSILKDLFLGLGFASPTLPPTSPILSSVLIRSVDLEFSCFVGVLLLAFFCTNTSSISFELTITFSLFLPLVAQLLCALSTFRVFAFSLILAACSDVIGFNLGLKVHSRIPSSSLFYSLDLMSSIFCFFF